MAPKHKFPIFKIYKGVVCLETKTEGNIKWWDQGYGLDYSPYEANKITKVKHGRLKNSGREVLATHILGEGWVAINTPRSDIMALINRGLWPQSMPLPYEKIKHYTPRPKGYLTV